MGWGGVGCLKTLWLDTLSTRGTYVWDGVRCLKTLWLDTLSAFFLARAVLVGMISRRSPTSQESGKRNTVQKTGFLMMIRHLFWVLKTISSGVLILCCK